MLSLLRSRDRRAKLAALDRSQAVIEFRLDGTILHANRNFLDAVGYELAEIKGRHHGMFVPPEHRDGDDYKAFWGQLRRGEFQQGEYRRVGKDGREIWLQATYNPVRGLAGRPIKVVKFASDITAAKRQAIDAAGKVDAIGRSQAIVELALDGTVLDVNSNFEATMGYSLDEVRGRHHSTFVDPAEAAGQAYRDFWASLGEGRFTSGEYRRFAKGGREVWLQATYNPIRDPEGRVFKVVKFATDVTAAKQRSADHAGQMTAIGRSQAVIEFALDGTILDANDNFLAAMGYGLDEIQGRHHGLFVDDAYRASPEYHAFWDELRGGAFKAAEFRRLGKGGREVWIQATYNPILGTDGRPFKVVKFASDITAQVQQRAKFNLLSLVADETDNSVVITTPHGLIEYVNPGFCRLTGYQTEQVLGRKPGELLQGQHTDAATVARIRQNLRERKPFYDEILNYTTGGEP